MFYCTQNQQYINEGNAFEINGVQYPANWLNLTTLAEKEAIGITEVSDPIRADDRFYWDGDINNPKDLSQCKAMLISQVKETAGTILSQTDWTVIRKAERNVDIPADIVAYRAEVVSKATELETSITAVTTVEQLAALNLSFPSKD